MEETAKALYDKAPRWVKVIRWREWGQRIFESQKKYSLFLYIPSFLCFAFYTENPSALQIYLRRPQTEEELMKIKHWWNTNEYVRNWEKDQYQYQVPPLYDLAERRKKYPEYYEGRYDGFKKYDV